MVRIAQDAFTVPPEMDVEVRRLRERVRALELEVKRCREAEQSLRESELAQRRAAQGRLFASEARFHHLVDAVTDYAIFMLDATGHVTTWNTGAKKAKGYDAEEILGRHFSVFYTPEDREAGRPAHILETLRREGRFEEESWRVRKDGSRFWANVVINALRGPSGEITGYAKVTRDLTSRREREEHERALAREQQASQAKDEFLATMSHELRTPLNAVLGWATILNVGAGKPRDEAKLARGLQVIERNARAQARLVGDLLDMSRIVSGKLRLSLRRTEISAVVHAAADVVRPAADAKGVRLLVDLDPGMGSNIVDPDRLQQIVWNLLTNAVRYTPRDGWVIVTGERGPSGVRINVQDNGAGIRREHLAVVFERFRQIDSSTTRSQGGLGLGLAIVRHLVEAHGGSVEASSEGEGRGASFTIMLPIRALDPPPFEEDRLDRDGEGAYRAATSEAGLLRDVRVLVVDDDPDSIEVVGEALGSVGADVTAATSARDALEARGPFDVIVSDIGMPGMDGYSFMRNIRSRDKGADVPAIALTAYARDADGERALRAGYQEHLAKPVDARKLIEAVKTWAQTRRAANG
jgi:PAS domain S-box-containing protein